MVDVQIETNQNDTVESSTPAAKNQEDKTFGEKMADWCTSRPFKYDLLCITYAVILIGVGIYAYVDKHQTTSLVASLSCAICLALAIYYEGVKRCPYPLVFVLLAISGILEFRWVKSEKYVPAGLMYTVAMLLLLRHMFLLWASHPRFPARQP